jgi:hypothetical protein
MYDPIGDSVMEGHAYPDDLLDQGRLAGWDLFHLHWPESFAGDDVARHRAAIASLQESGVRIVLTQHNLVAHSKSAPLEEVYRLWAAAAHGVAHHSQVGMRRAMERWRHREDAVHRVVPHLHFGPVARGDRAGGDGELLRLGVVGSPRAEKDVQLVLDAVAACTRQDLRLSVFCLDGERVPDDPRIEALPYERVAREEYDRRLASVDALVLPFAPEGMLTTGTVGDVIGAGLAAVVSDWEFLHETLGAAAIPYGSTREDLVRTLERLDRDTVRRAAAAAVALQDAHAPARVAQAHLGLLEAVGTTRL